MHLKQCVNFAVKGDMYVILVLCITSPDPISLSPMCMHRNRNQETKGVSVVLSNYKDGAIKVEVPRMQVTEAQASIDRGRERRKEENERNK